MSDTQTMIARMTSQTPEPSITAAVVPDEELMLRVLGRDRSAFRQLVDRWQQPLVNYFYRHLAAAEPAEELAQEVFVKIWTARSYVPRTPFGAWFWRLARNQLIDYLRAQGRRPQASADDEALSRLPEAGSGPEEALLAAEERRALQAALQALPLRQRNVLILSKFQGLKYQQIAETLGCSVANVKVQVFRAVQALGKHFEGARHD